jgi:hypothetical protein
MSIVQIILRSQRLLVLIYLKGRVSIRFAVPKSSSSFATPAKPFLSRAVRVKLGAGNPGSVSAAMISDTVRKRLIYAAMSVFLAWHTLALIVAPAPLGSVMAERLHVLLQPYLSLLRLDNPWNFFAPYSGRMNTSRFRYVIEDAAGQKLIFTPAEELGRFNPSYFWFRAWYTEVIDQPDDYADIAAALYCRRHASLNPVSITLLEIEEKDFMRTDFLAGKDRWSPEFVTEKTIRRVLCPAN